MTRRFATEVHIDAEPACVWRELVRTEHWTSWDPALTSVDGEFRSGGRVTFRTVHSERAFASRVVEWSEPVRIVLRGGMPLGLFVGTRTYDLAAADGGTSFRMTEEFSGVLAGLITKRLPDLQPSFDAFAAGLRGAVETATERR